MPYTLDQFCEDCHQALAADKGPGGREAVRRNLEQLLAEKAFLDKHVLLMPPGRHTLFEDPELGFVVLSHVNTKASKSPPHDHGASWAIYGQASEYTDMTEWRRTKGDGPGNTGSNPVMPAPTTSARSIRSIIRTARALSASPAPISTASSASNST
jgi:hypothetical protein